MSLSQFQCFLWVMSGTALLVFIALYYVKAGYGMFRTPSWGYSIDNRLAWVLMECPVFWVMLWLWMESGVYFSMPQFLLFLLFELHYLQRSFIFPLLMKGRSRMPLSIVLMGILFNILNGLMQAGGIFWFAPDGYSEGVEWLIHPESLAGLFLFIAGMFINLHSDHVIRCLRKPGDRKHYLPERGMYRYVTSANYLGELIEWTGFALLAATPAAWVFVWWTAANLIPRSHAIYKHYCQEFGCEAVGNRKRILPFIY